MKNRDINLIRYALKLSWSKDTCHLSCIGKYNESDKSTGQCAISSLVINDYLGGGIQSGYIDELNLKHYWNVINDNIIDTTKEQFDKEYEFKDIKEKSREEMLSNEDTKRRYLILKSKVDKFIDEIIKIDALVNNCNKCSNNVEKFSGNSIYFGKRTDILFVGEAPANNGWRKSGLLWRYINGKFLPSAIILQKLLNVLNINILDITFLEAVKCYPVERKHLKICSKNCEEILQKCITTLKPKMIITLGEYPTKILLNAKEKFSDLVGNIITINIMNNEYKVLPIYHPSPISPKSYEGNIPIFEMLSKKNFF